MNSCMSLLLASPRRHLGPEYHEVFIHCTIVVILVIIKAAKTLRILIDNLDCDDRKTLKVKVKLKCRKP